MNVRQYLNCIMKVLDNIRIYNSQQIVMSQWNLKQEFLKNDMDRIDNPEYFMMDFHCQQLNKFFLDIATQKQVVQHRQSINLFYDRFLSMNLSSRTIYIQAKWILILHQILQRLKPQSLIYSYTLKALQVCIQDLKKFEQSQGPFEKYLLQNLIKPYLQYISKLCLLSMPTETMKYDKSSILSISTKPQEDNESHENNYENKQIINQEEEILNLKLVDWYRKYNFISATVELFERILSDMHCFFKDKFPFLNNIGKTICSDLNGLIFKLKYSYRSLKKSNVTIIEIDQLENKLKLFSIKSNQYAGDQTDIFIKPEQISKLSDLNEFLFSPLKLSQLRLYSKKSVSTPLLQFINS